MQENSTYLTPRPWRPTHSFGMPSKKLLIYLFVWNWFGSLLLARKTMVDVKGKELKAAGGGVMGFVLLLVVGSRKK